MAKNKLLGMLRGFLEEDGEMGEDILTLTLFPLAYGNSSAKPILFLIQLIQPITNIDSQLLTKLK